MNKVKYFMTLAVFLIYSAGVAEAGLVTFSGNTAGQPTWTRPTAGSPPTSLGPTSPYDAWQFVVDTAGVYSLTTTSASFDTYLHLFQNAFDPGNPLGNILAGNDDGGVGLLSRIDYSLNPGTEYFMIISGFGGDSGPYTGSMEGPGNIDLSGPFHGASGGGAIPEPGTALMLGAGLACLWAFHRRRAVAR